jgi:hypothetical protein
MSEEALNETKNSTYMPVQEYNGPGVITMKNLGEKEAMATPSNYISVFPKFMCMQLLHHIQELGKHM